MKWNFFLTNSVNISKGKTVVTSQEKTLKYIDIFTST